MKDYKGKDSHKALGLRRGKAAIRRETSSSTRRRIFMWTGLIGLVMCVNYLFLVRMGPFGKKGFKFGRSLKGQSVVLGDWCEKAHERYQQGDLEGAIEAYTCAIALQQEEAVSYNNRGIIYLVLGELDKALEDYTKAIALNPDYAEAYHNRGSVYFRKGLLDLAIQDCNRAILLDSDMAIAYHTRGRAYQGKGLFEKAKNDFQKSCSLGNTSSCQAYEALSN